MQRRRGRTGRGGGRGGRDQITAGGEERRGKRRLPPQVSPWEFCSHTPPLKKKYTRKPFIGEIQLFHSLCDTQPAKTNLYVLQAPDVRFFRFVWGIPGLIVSNFEVSVSKRGGNAIFFVLQVSKQKGNASFFFDV